MKKPLESRSAAEQVNYWARVGQSVALHQAASRRRVEAVLTGTLPMSVLRPDEREIVNAELDVAITTTAQSMPLGAAVAADGVTTVALDDEGGLLEYRPDGTSTVLDPVPEDGSGDHARWAAEIDRHFRLDPTEALVVTGRSGGCHRKCQSLLPSPSPASATRQQETPENASADGGMPQDRGVRSRLRLLPVLAAVSLVAPLMVSTAGPATAGPEIRRLAGTDRYTTSVAVSRASHPAGAPVAVLTTGASFPDALAGGPAAAALGGPVLLVARDDVPDEVMTELSRLKPKRVLVLGGTGAVSSTPVQELTRAGYAVERISGNGRYDTAAAISQETFATGTSTAYVATGADYPDALAGTAAAGRAGAPILLVGRDELPAATAVELERLRPQRVIVLGGLGAVSAKVEQQLAAYVGDAGTVTRISGQNRYDTAAAIARSTPGRPPVLYLANGQGFADALSGGPAAAKAGAPVLLVPPTCIPGPVHNEMVRHDYPPVTLLGGAAVLKLGVAELRPCFDVPDGEISPGVTLNSIRDPRGPWAIKVVSVAPGAMWRLDPILAQDKLAGLETTSSMARRTKAVVAINGDFAQVNGKGRPLHAFAKDGRLHQDPLNLEMLGGNFAINAQQNTSHLGAPTVNTAFHSPGSQVRVTRVNRGPSDSGAIALTTPTAGSAAVVPGNSCALQLKTHDLVTKPDGRVWQGYEILQSRCASAPMPAEGHHVVTTPMGGRWDGLFRGLLPGQVVSVSWTPGWTNVLDTIGGHPMVLEGGAILSEWVDAKDSFTARNPRTAIGTKPDGTVLLVTVDGRGADGSVGMSLRELASLFQRLGATDALNLDGGGSTTMVIGGEVQNSPSDGPERAVSSALLVMSGSAPTAGLRTQSGAPAPAVPLSPQEQAAAEARIAADPGSTGGLRNP